MFRQLADGLLAVFLAPVCAACRRPLDAPTRSVVCRACWKAIRPMRPPFCPVCGDPLVSWRPAGPDDRCSACRTTRPHVTRGRCAGEYDDTLRAVLLALKYEGRTSVGRELSGMMRERGSAVLAGADCVVPVPLHWRRRWIRGFNQAEALAAGLGLPVIRALRRTRHTPSQTDLPAEQRRGNVRNAFKVRREAPIAGRCVVVVDDVSTTGATLEACARVLRQAGAREVRTITAARVVTRPPAGRPR